MLFKNQYHSLLSKTLLLLLALSLSCNAQMKLVKPRVFVRNEMIPDAVNISTNLQLNRCDFFREDRSDTAGITINRLNIYALPLVLKSDAEMLLAAGGSYGLTRSSQPLKKRYQTVTADLLAINNLGDKWYLFSYLSCGLFSDQLFNTPDKSTKVMALVTGGYKWSENLSTAAGAVYFSNFGDPLILPGVRFSYSPANWLFYLMLPQGAEIRYLAKDNLHFIAGCTINSESYFDSQSKLIVKLEEVKPVAGFHYRIWQNFWLKSMIEFGRTEFKTDDKAQGSTADQWRTEIKFSYIVPAE